MTAGGVDVRVTGKNEEKMGLTLPLERFLINL